LVVLRGFWKKETLFGSIFMFFPLEAEGQSPAPPPKPTGSAAKADWIRRHQARIAAQSPRPKLRYVTGEEHRFLGTAHVLEVRPATGRVGAAAIGAATHEAPPRLVVHARDPHDAAEVQRHLECLQRRELQRRLDALVPEWEERLGVRTTRIRIRAMKRKWGACRTRTGDVVFNRSLAAEPPRAIEYLVLHELAHLIESSHGPRFQAILTEHMPDWRAVESALNGKVTTRG
jgi:predicted metal-dependent hydrolase